MMDTLDSYQGRYVVCNAGKKAGKYKLKFGTEVNRGPPLREARGLARPARLNPLPCPRHTVNIHGYSKRSSHRLYSNDYIKHLLKHDQRANVKNLQTLIIASDSQHTRNLVNVKRRRSMIRPLSSIACDPLPNRTALRVCCPTSRAKYDASKRP